MMANPTQNRRFPIQKIWDRFDPVSIQMQECSFKNQRKNLRGAIYPDCMILQWKWRIAIETKVG